jgi:putative iron-dependent peroxidase
MTLPAQPGILEPVPPFGRHMFFKAVDLKRAPGKLALLNSIYESSTTVVGLGTQITRVMGKSIEHMRDFQAIKVTNSDLTVPSTVYDLWVWLRVANRGDSMQLSNEITYGLVDVFFLENVVDTFLYQSGRDLTGYKDGTENPKNGDAIEAALVQNKGLGLNGSSFAVIQHWVHDFDAFDLMSPDEQDKAIGRRMKDDFELYAAPETAHVKRANQERFHPPARVLRRSMPWRGLDGSCGLEFLAFGKTFDAFESQMRRMAGLDDGITDALFGFSKPLTSSYFWCPPMRGKRLDLTAIGL